MLLGLPGIAFGTIRLVTAEVWHVAAIDEQLRTVRGIPVDHDLVPGALHDAAGDGDVDHVASPRIGPQVISHDPRPRQAEPDGVDRPRTQRRILLEQATEVG